jgi:tetratricopeptide (TPR) repeat protein
VRGVPVQARRLVASLLVVAVCAAAALAEAGTFEGLEPGVSTRTDTDRVLGPPTREVVAGVRYDYDPSPYDARRISIRFDPDTGTIVTIDLHLTTNYAKKDYREWFELGQPTSTASDDDGNLVESYLPQAISLHYSGPDDSFAVAFFRHFDAQTKSPVVPTHGSGTTTGDSLGVNSKPFLGASFATDHGGQGVRIREIHPNSPAERAGLRSGDVILEFGEHALYGSPMDPWEFVVLIGTMPTGTPTRLIVERGTQRAALEITLERRDTREIETERRRLAFEAYQQGESLFRQGEYERAIPHLERAYNFNPHDGRTLELLGYCRLRERRYEEALRAYNTALQRMPDSATVRYFIGGCHDALGNAQQAVDYYQQYLSSNDTDRKKRKYAQRRVNALTSQADEQVNWGEVFADVIDAVRQEMGDD